MAQNKPEGRYGKVSYIAPAIIGAIVVALVLFSLPDSPQPTPPPITQAPPVPPLTPVVATPPVITAPPVLARRDLVDTARDVASRFAAEGRMTATTAALVGRKFSLRIAFGCAPAQAAPGVLQGSVQVNEGRDSVTLTVRPALWADLPLVQALPNRSAIETVEGFWIPRPWLDSEDCPPLQSTPAPAVSTPPSAQTLGLARFFGPGESRAQRHAEHPYQITIRRQSDPSSAPAGYRLLLEGELAAFPDGNALNCWMESAMHRPVCLYSVRLSHVAFEDSRDGKVLAEWDR